MKIIQPRCHQPGSQAKKPAELHFPVTDSHIFVDPILIFCVAFVSTGEKFGEVQKLWHQITHSITISGLD